MANCLLPDKLMATRIGEMSGHAGEGTVRIQRYDDVYLVKWTDPAGLERADHFPAQWALLSLNEFESSFAALFMPKALKKELEKPSCACTWELKGDSWSVTSMCGAHHDFVRKYCVGH